MARQNTSPVTFNATTRRDRVIGMTSGRAGQFIPILRGDSASGQFVAEVELGEMPKPLLNAVGLNLQAWYVPKSAYPYFSGYDEFMYSYQQEQIPSLGAVLRDPPEFFRKLSGQDMDDYEASDFVQKLGLHMEDTADFGANTDLLDAYNLIWNFRAGAHSTKITRASYAEENITDALTLKRAFWPTGRHSHIVPDYERALVIGALDLDVSAGQLPVSGIDRDGASVTQDTALVQPDANQYRIQRQGGAGALNVAIDVNNVSSIYAEMSGETVTSSLADIDKARLTQSFAKLRASYAGNDYSGFDPDNVIVAELMQGFSVPRELFQRPWLLDSKRATFGMVERFATDSANLDASVSVGKAMAQLSLNVPAQDTGGYILICMEVLPERLHERQGDPVCYLTNPDVYPNALRDIQRAEPVDYVHNWRIDARHTSPDALYGYEPMNGKWDRDFTRLGGDFYQADPLNPFKESRAGIWTPNMVDPVFTSDHWMAPDPFPHDVFSDTAADAFEVAYSHNLAIRGITQIGDVLVENNDDFQAVKDEGDGV